MKIGFVIYEGMTALDFVGVFDPLTRLKTMGFMPELAWDVCAFAAGAVRDGAGLRIEPDKAGGSLEHYDMVVLPGGFGSRSLIHNGPFVDWIRSAAACPVKASVCTGALLLGAAGFLKGLPATTHPGAYELLRGYCAEVREDRVVDAGAVVTARGVTAAIDLGLYLGEKLAGPAAAGRIRGQMDYQG
ncbi:MAG TPA: DJ-1/PfpI family protein [Selenomonadales bacterium]|nr:DJ-1/PfpI family protein [Selenomonadales bacterium]